MKAFEQMELGSIDVIQLDTEQELYIKICDLIKNTYEDSANLTLKTNQNYSTIKFFKVPKLRIKTINKEACLEVPEHFQYLIEKHGINNKVLSDDYMRIRIPNNGINEQLKALLLDIYDYCYWKYSDDRFDCCSKYLECSDKKTCYYESEKLSRACRYRNTMKTEKKIFYGNNRNIK